MSEKNKLTVKINGREYTITSVESREYMLRVADLVDRNMQEVARTAPQLNTTMTAVLAALNLAEECVRLQQANKQLMRDVAAAGGSVRSPHERNGF